MHPAAIVRAELRAPTDAERAARQAWLDRVAHQDYVDPPEPRHWTGGLVAELEHAHAGTDGTLCGIAASACDVYRHLFRPGAPGSCPACSARCEHGDLP